MSKRKNRVVSNQVTELQAASDRMTPERKAYLDKFVADRFPADVIQLIEELTPLPADAGPMQVQMLADLRQAIKAGFVLALARYSRELKGNAEAMAMINARRIGGDKGRRSQAKNKTDRIPEINAMIAGGKSVKQIAATLKVDPSTIYRALTPAKHRPKR